MSASGRRRDDAVVVGQITVQRELVLRQFAQLVGSRPHGSCSLHAKFVNEVRVASPAPACSVAVACCFTHGVLTPQRSGRHWHRAHQRVLRVGVRRCDALPRRVGAHVRARTPRSPPAADRTRGHWRSLKSQPSRGKARRQGRRGFACNRRGCHTRLCEGRQQHGPCDAQSPQEHAQEHAQEPAQEAEEGSWCSIQGQAQV